MDVEHTLVFVVSKSCKTLLSYFKVFKGAHRKNTFVD